MSTQAILDDSAPGAMPSITPGKFGMWLVLVSEIMFFAALIGSYIVLRLGHSNWPTTANILNIPLLTLNTVVLITSSLTMALSVEAAESGKKDKLPKYLLLTILFGLTFLGIKVYDYIHMWNMGFTVSSDLFGSCYYLLTGFHGLHVLAGLICLTYLYVKARKGVWGPKNHGRVEYIGLYWHFVDAVWVFLFAVLALL